MTTNLSPEARAVLVKARARIDAPEKWCKGEEASITGVETGGPTCASLAIVGPPDPFGHYAKAEQEAFRALCVAAHIKTLFGLADWNDDPARTHAEVMAAFDRALARPVTP